MGKGSQLDGAVDEDFKPADQACSAGVEVYGEGEEDAEASWVGV